jgi:carbamoyltransferase
MAQWIAGITRGHNGATCLLKDGELVFYIEEERLSRKKYDGGPLAGMIKILEYTDKLDYLVVAHTQPLSSAGKIDFVGDDIFTGLARKLGLIDQYNEDESHPQVIDLGLIHHELHAACAFYNSGFESATCLIVDGAGTFVQLGDSGEIGWELETIFSADYPAKFNTYYKHIGVRGPAVTYEKLQVPHAHRGHDNLHDVLFSDHPGITKCYEAMTHYCGFRFIEAGKAMGLAPYGKPNSMIPPIFLGEEGKFLSNRNLFVPNYPNGAYIDKVSFSTLDTDNIEMKKDLAYAVQTATQEQMLRLILDAVERTGNKNVCIAGGYGLNCVANYEYLKHLPSDINLYVEPIAHDGGTCIGAAKLVYHDINKDTTVRKQTSIYYGPNYFEKYGNYKIDLQDDETITDVSKDDIVKLITDGNIVCMYQGRSEAGPRALGNRSIMFDPRVKNGKDIVNEVKHREWFRPFAGTILKEYVHDWFDLRGMDETPFMMYAVDCQEGVADKIPSIIHVDGTCRIQTVTSEQNAHYYELISKFNDATGVPILFNTSFNLGGEPLVETIEDALRTLRYSGLDYLYLPEIEKLIHIPKNLSEE